MAEMVRELTGAEDVLWDLSALYNGSDDPVLESDLTRIITDSEAFANKYRGRVASLTVSELVAAMEEAEVLYECGGRLQSFAQLQWSVGTDNAAYGALLQRVREVGTQAEQTTLFFELEWAAIPDSHIKILDDPALARWRHYLLKQLENRPHLLTEPEEKILAEKSLTGGQAWTRYFEETMGASRYDFKGEQVPQDVVLRSLYVPDRTERLAAADSFTAGLRQTLRTNTYIFNTLLAEKASNDKLRKYPTWISARNMANEASDETVEALVKAVTSRYDIVQRYYNLKRKLLGYESLHEYDRYAPLEQSVARYTWSQAKDIVLSAYHAFSPDAGKIAAEFFEKNWIHAPAITGKRSGAFASPTIPSAHPFVLVNFTGVGRDVMTLAHELGHGIHQYLARPKGTFGAYTPLTTAEMASIFGEMLVFNDLMSRETDRQIRISMLAQKLEDTFATVFRQVSMNRFEDLIHTARRTEGELTSARISELWMTSQRAMFGSSLTLRDEYSVWWSYIWHFLGAPGYVYAYAFGELLVMALFNVYKMEGQSFVPRYMDVLAAGGSDKPEKILHKAGIELTDPNFWQQGLTIIDEMVKQLEDLVESA